MLEEPLGTFDEMIYPAVGVAALLVIGIAIDVWLIRQKHPTLSAFSRTNAGKIFRVILEGHFSQTLPANMDPFKAIPKLAGLDTRFV